MPEKRRTKAREIIMQAVSQALNGLTDGVEPWAGATLAYRPAEREALRCEVARQVAEIERLFGYPPGTWGGE